MIVILGSGISGLSLSYFLSLNGIKNLVIEKNKSVGIRYRSTCLVSDRIFKYLNFVNKDLILKKFKIANFWYKNEKLISIFGKKEMFLLNYIKLEKEIFKNIDKTFSNFLFNEKVLDINLEKNFLITNKRKINFEIFVDASGTYSFLANKFNLFKFKKLYNSFEALVISKSKLENINIFFDKNFSKTKFGWYIDLNDKALIGLIDVALKIEKFRKFLEKFKIEKIYYLYSHPILFCKLKRLQTKNSLIIGEAAGLIKPFSLGGITYGIISSFIASQLIKNNKVERYEKIIMKIFSKSILLGNIINKLINKKNLMKVISFFKLNKLSYFLDLDFIDKNI